MVQWLRLHAPNEKGLSLIPSQETSIEHAVGAAKTKKRKFHSNLLSPHQLHGLTLKHTLLRISLNWLVFLLTSV